MAKFRKKPVVIDAYQVPHPDPGHDRAEVPLWVTQAVLDRAIVMDPKGGALVPTLEGTMRADVGDWIIRGVKGELYPCKPDIFAATYEPAEAPTALTKREPVDKRTTGLYHKFDVRRTDGSDAAGGKHDGCRYFVLDLDHDPNAMPALRAYAKSCEKDFPALAHDLRAVADGNGLIASKIDG